MEEDGRKRALEPAVCLSHTDRHRIKQSQLFLHASCTAVIPANNHRGREERERERHWESPEVAGQNSKKGTPVPACISCVYFCSPCYFLSSFSCVSFLVAASRHLLRKCMIITPDYHHPSKSGESRRETAKNKKNNTAPSPSSYFCCFSFSLSSAQADDVPDRADSDCATLSRISLITRFGFGEAITAVPETIILAPASATQAIVAGPTPPSTSMSRCGKQDRNFCTLGII